MNDCQQGKKVQANKYRSMQNARCNLLLKYKPQQTRSCEYHDKRSEKNKHQHKTIKWINDLKI